MTMKNTMMSLVPWLLVAAMSISCSQQQSEWGGKRFSAADVPMEAVVDHRNRLILVTGAIDSNENTIVVEIPNVPVGEWTIIKSETNLTDQPWNTWEIVFGENTVALDNMDGNLSGQYARFTPIGERNALIFHAGSVVPGAAVLKIFRINQRTPGTLRMGHYRAAVEASREEMEKGLPRLPEVKFELPVRVIE